MFFYLKAGLPFLQLLSTVYIIIIIYRNGLFSTLCVKVEFCISLVCHKPYSTLHSLKTATKIHKKNKKAKNADCFVYLHCLCLSFSLSLSLPLLNHEALRWSMWMRGVVIVCVEMSQRGDTDVFFSCCGPALTRHVPEFNSTDISLPIISHPLVFIFGFIIWFRAIKISLKYKCQ